MANLKLDLNKFIPGALKNEMLSSVVTNVFNKFISEEDSISVNGRIGKSQPGEAQVFAENLDRKVNALTPALFWPTASEKNVFSFDDFLYKLKTLGINSNTLKSWLKQKSFNFVPPINLDKFVNYSNYFWIGKQDVESEKQKFSNWNMSVDPEYYVIQKGDGAQNSWQISNKWMHRDDFEESGFDLKSAIQASRPIIEFKSSLELNAFYADNPKSRFNEIPQFNLYNYDGTPRNQTSGLFYYLEDPTFTIDSILRKRIKTDKSGNWIFEIPHLKNDAFVFFKDGGSISSFWASGPDDSTVYSMRFNSSYDENKGNDLLQVDFEENSLPQKWTLVCYSPNKFNIFGSRSGKVGVISAGGNFQHYGMRLTLSEPSSPFLEGESYTFNVFGPSIPRYVKEDEGGEFIDFLNSPKDDYKNEGAWEFPEQLLANFNKKIQYNISYPSLIEHFADIMHSQTGFAGFSKGANNFRTLENTNFGLGGKIKLFDGNLHLLFSILAQKDLSILSIIEFAEAQYNSAIASVDQFLLTEFASYFGANIWDAEEDITENSACISSLFNAFENFRALDENIKSVFFDTTAKVKNWPATLPMFGLVRRVLPKITFDNELGLNVIMHHDGHISPTVERDIDFEITLANTPVIRSDGTKSAGYITSLAPQIPYARQLWFNKETIQLYYFDVDYDTVAEPEATTGQYWLNRSLGELKVKTADGWQSAEINDRWKILDFSTIRNSLVVKIEKLLYDSVNPKFDLMLAYNVVDKSSQSEFNESELARFSNKYNYDTYAPDFKQEDAFTWNYSDAFVSIPEALPPARWFDVYKNYFQHFYPSVIPTCRPNLEPWKLLGETNKPVNWDSLYKAEFSLFDIDTSLLPYAKPVKAILSIDSILERLIDIDNVSLVESDRILVINQADTSKNGLYRASSGLWVNISDTISNGTAIEISSGDKWQSTKWIKSNDSFFQLRLWKNEMWDYIKSERPSLKLGVNTATDELLPPYVSRAKSFSSEAIFTEIPQGISASYKFGNNGPIEIVWKKSIEFLYSAAKNAFRESPLEFINLAWGFNFISYAEGGLKLESNTLTPLSNDKFLFHGEKLHNILQLTEQQCKDRITGIPTDLTTSLEFIAAAHDNGQIEFDIFENGNKISRLKVNTTQEVAFSTPASLKISDLGIPYSLGDSIKIKTVNAVQQFNFKPSSKAIFNGVCQWFTNQVRFSCIDTNLSDISNAYRGWDLKLCYRTGSLIKPLSFSTSSASTPLPDTEYQVVFKNTQRTKSYWITALRVQLVDMGPFNSRVKNEYGFYIPSADASDWVFRIEGYNNQNPVLEYNVFDNSQNGAFQTFSALNDQNTKLIWKRYTEKTSTSKITLPLIVTGLQNVINVIYGYIDKLKEDGWVFDDIEFSKIDEETGRNINWQLEIEKFIDRVYTGMSAGEGHILNPFMDRLTIDTPVGVLSKFTENNFSDLYSAQAIFDVVSGNVPLNKITVYRTDNRSSIVSLTPIFSAHVFTDEYEHVVLFDESAGIFDSFSGYKIDSMYVNFIRNSSLRKKPTFDGFFLSGNESRRNIMSSIDSIANYYDSGLTFNSEESSSHALALLGFTDKKYFNDISVSRNTQFNFWRGLIQAKGTNMSIDAVLNHKDFLDAGIDEFWAYKIAEFGDSRDNICPEIKINTEDAAQTHTRFQFYDIDDQYFDPLVEFNKISSIDDKRWYSIDDIGTVLKFDAEKIHEIVEVGDEGSFPKFVKLKNIYHNGDYAITKVTKVLRNDENAPKLNAINPAAVINSNIIKVNSAGFYKVEGYTWKNASKFSPIKVIDYKENVLVKQIGLWHPAIGIHNFEALEIINTISDSNPALYNYETITETNPTFKSLKPWGKKEVGKVWWNTENLGYVPYYDAKIFNTRKLREVNWGKMADWASVDVYEWVESPVHPSEYNDLANAEEGNIEIDESIRAGGEVAVTKTYSRNRIINAVPIAWSQLGQADGDGHPAFGLNYFVKIYAASNKLILDKGRFSEIDLTTGKNFAAWKNNKPYGEVTIGDQLEYFIGSSTKINEPVLNPELFLESMKMGIISNSLFGSKIGKIKVDGILKKSTISKMSVESNPEEVTISKYYIRLSDTAGYYEDAEISEWYSDNPEIDKTISFQFDSFGLYLELQRKIDTPKLLTPEFIYNSLGSNHDIVIRESINFEEIIPLPDIVFSNDETDPEFNQYEYGWKSWNLPAQDDLDNDLLYSPRKWKPYVGDMVQKTITADILKDMKAGNFKYALRDNTIVSRYVSSWDIWRELKDQVITAISDGVTNITHTFEADEDVLDSSRIKVYHNGKLIKSDSYNITAKTLSLLYLVPLGHSIRMVYQRYSPSSSDLDFNPEVEDDVSIQRQYKIDYEYSYFDNIDENGNLIGKKYYFWVKDKTVAKKKYSMSTYRAKTLLRDGPSEYMLLSRAINRNSSLYFDSCSIFGLNALITKDNSYKLRFIRNYTLRDDPEEMKLKNVHAEWTLIRRGQSKKIPQQLWRLLIDAICGEDEAGNKLPSQNRIDYDARNGTRYRFGFKRGQIFADSDLMKSSIKNSIINSPLTIKIGNKKIQQQINLDVLGTEYNSWQEALSDSKSCRFTLNRIWERCSPKQINHLFFNALEDAHSNNFEFSDIFKTSMLSLSVKRKIWD